MLSMTGALKQRSIVPGFGLTMGVTLIYLSLIVLFPLSAAFLKTATMGWHEFWHTVTSPRAMASYRVTFGASLAAAVINVCFGTLVAWVLSRYDFPGKRLFDAFVDLPFALPTAVAGIALASIYGPQGILGKPLAAIGIHAAFSLTGIVIALTFIGLPFVVRTIQPVLQEFDRELEEAAASLGARRWQTLVRVIAPTILPAAVTGFALAFARAIGEYGSVIFIAGNMPMRTEITPLLIITKLEQYDYRGATAVAVAMLAVSFALLLCINGFQRWMSQDGASERAAT